MEYTKQQDKGYLPMINDTEPWDFMGASNAHQISPPLSIILADELSRSIFQWPPASPLVQSDSLGSPPITFSSLSFSRDNTPLLVQSPVPLSCSLPADSFLHASGFDAPIQPSNSDALMPSAGLPLAATNRVCETGSTDGHTHLNTTLLQFSSTLPPIMSGESSRARSISCVERSPYEAFPSTSCEPKHTSVSPRHTRSRQISPPNSPTSPLPSNATPSTDPSSPTEKIYYCTTCSYKTIRKRDRNRHIRSVHTRETPYVCEACEMGFVRSDARARHWKKVALCRELHEEMVRLGLKK